MNPTILPPAIGKIVGYTALFGLDYDNQSRSKKNSEFKPAKLRLKIDLVSHPARA